MATRVEHLKWCKDRAIKLANQDKLEEAIFSMFSDLGKHPETEGQMTIEFRALLMKGGQLSTKVEIINFINGFD